MMRALWLVVFLVTGFPAWSQEGKSAAAFDDQKAAALMSEGMSLLKAGKPTEAIGVFDKVAAGFEDKYRGDKSRFFCVRSQAESLIYLTQFAASGGGKSKVVSSDWAYAYYLKGYALVELGRIKEARPFLERALELGPRNAQFLIELAGTYQRERNWEESMKLLKQAESAAREVSPAKSRDTELARAWRGMGYNLIEMGRLDEAEKLYRQCLELDKNDAKAINELNFIQKQRARQNARPEAGGGGSR